MLTKDLPPIGYLASFHLENCFPAQRISPMLRRLILSCVQPNPQQRPNNFQELRRALASVYHDSTGTSALPQAEPLEMSIGELNDKGVALRRLGYHDEARACFKRAMDVSPDHPILLQN